MIGFFQYLTIIGYVASDVSKTSLTPSLMTSVAAMLVAASSDLLPNVKSESSSHFDPDSRSTKHQARLSPLFHADRNCHFEHIRKFPHTFRSLITG